MKCFKKIVPIILILFIGLKVVMADNEEDDNFGEIFGDIIAFIIGDLIGSCLVDTVCLVAGSLLFAPLFPLFLLSPPSFSSFFFYLLSYLNHMMCIVYMSIWTMRIYDVCVYEG